MYACSSNKNMLLVIGILAQRTFAPFSPWRRSRKLITEQNRVVIGVKCVESEYNHCVVVYIVTVHFRVDQRPEAECWFTGSSGGV